MSKSKRGNSKRLGSVHSGRDSVQSGENGLGESVSVSTPAFKELGLWNWLKHWLLLPVSGASLACFRFALGLVVLLETSDHLRPSQSTGGKAPLETYYTGSNVTFNFPYEGFGWLPLLPGPWMTGAVLLLCLASVTLALGLFYRTSSVTVFLLWAYLYAVESTRTYWMSYYYLVLLLTFLVIWMPAARCYSLDAWRRRGREGGRGRNVDRPRSVPFWTLMILRAQLVVAYFYGGLAKVNADWLLDAMPVRWYLAKDHVLAPFGRVLTETQLAGLKEFLTTDLAAYFISYTGALFDLSVGFLLLFRRTRIFGLVLLGIFHLTNHFVLFDDIGWFPLAGLGTALVFLNADWPDRLKDWIKQPRVPRPDWRWFWVGGVLIPIVGAALGWRSRRTLPMANLDITPTTPSIPTTQASSQAEPALEKGNSGFVGPSFWGRIGWDRWVLPCIGFWLLLQIAFPLRAYLIPGDARMTWEGLRFSWRLKAEVYRSMPCEIRIDDEELAMPMDDGRTRIDWTLWKQDPVIHRRVNPETVEWAELPEILILWDDFVGERILYNPLAAAEKVETLEAAQARVETIWAEVYGRSPGEIHKLLTLGSILDGYGTALRSKGMQWVPGINLLSVLDQLHGREGDGSMLGFMRRMGPCALSMDRPIRGPFLLVEDPVLMEPGRKRTFRIRRDQWIGSEASSSDLDRRLIHVGAHPLVLYTSQSPLEFMDRLGRVAMVDSLEAPDAPPRILWNLLQDVTISKGMHISIQPFLLRQYARRVATLWEETHGRWPAVRALTAVSLNGRPHQPVVDPDSDLASVDVVVMRRNEWIMDLETDRIPPEVLNGNGPG